MKTVQLLLMSALVTGIAGCNAAKSTDNAVDLEVREQRASYAQGYSIGRQGQGLEIQVDAFVQGVRDGLQDSGQLSDEEIGEAVADFQALLAEHSAGLAEDNKRAGEEFLASNAERPEVTVTESGLQYEVLREADGPRPSVTDTVTVQYRGTTLDGTVFDESYERGEPATFVLNRVIPGWTEGVQLMTVGSKYKFYVPSDLAYGDNAPPGAKFGPGATLVFEVELLGIDSQ